MAKMWAIAVNTFKEAIRNRILYILLIFALVIMASSGVISDLSIASRDRIVINLGVASINFFGLLIAIFVGIGLIYNELDKKTIYTIISKPIDRYQFLLGKYFGLLMTILLITAIMALFFLFVLFFQSYTTDDAITAALWKWEGNSHIGPTAVSYAWYLLKSFLISVAKAIGSFFFVYQYGATPKIMATILYGCFELAIITAFAVLFSTFSTPTLSAIFTVVIFIIGRLNPDLIRYAQWLKDKGLVSTLGGQIKYLFVVGAAHITPNLEIFNKRSDVIYANKIPFDLLTVGYGVIYPAMILLLAIIAFRRKSFK
jgi:ABC-type transport system involved in multi-copper enzyme maturation permease subunit